MSKEVAPDKVMEFLNLLFSKFDNDLDTYDCYKVSKGSLDVKGAADRCSILGAQRRWLGMDNAILVALQLFSHHSEG